MVSLGMRSSGFVGLAAFVVVGCGGSYSNAPPDSGSGADGSGLSDAPAPVDGGGSLDGATLDGSPESDVLDAGAMHDTSSGVDSSPDVGADVGPSCGNCTTNLDCQNLCPPVSGGGVNCCNPSSNACYVTTASVCPGMEAGASPTLIGEWAFVDGGGISENYYFNEDGSCGVFYEMQGQLECYTGTWSFVGTTLIFSTGGGCTSAYTVAFQDNNDATLTWNAADATCAASSTATIAREGSSPTNSCPP